ncbi:MAG: hypothetical protein ACRDGS_06590 [Chloroflexota bacterium]
MNIHPPPSAAHHDQRPLRVRGQNLLIDRWRVALPDDAEYPRQFEEAVYKAARRGTAVPYASAKQVRAERRRRALIISLRRLGDPAAGPRSLRGLHGWGGAGAVLATSWWMYRWSALLTDARIALAVSVSYVLTLYMLLHMVRKPWSAAVLSAWLFVFWLAISLTISYDTAPSVVSTGEVGHWLRTELPPRASRSAILAFIARHRNAKQIVSFDTISGERWISAIYRDQGSWLDYCPPDVEVDFELGATGRLIHVSVSENLTCS